LDRDQGLRLSRGTEARRYTWKDRGANFCRVIKEAFFVQGARPFTTYSNTSNADRYHWRQSFYGWYYTEPGRIFLLNVCSRSSPIMILENRIRLIEIQLRCQTPLNPPGNKSEGREGKDKFRRDFIRSVTTIAAKLCDGNWSNNVKRHTWTVLRDLRQFRNKSPTILNFACCKVQSKSKCEKNECSIDSVDKMSQTTNKLSLGRQDTFYKIFFNI